MLNGIDPIIIFSLKKKLDTSFIGPTQPDIPLVANIESFIDLPVIPIYLDERISGFVINSESKSIEIDTDTETLSSGGTPDVNQKGLTSSVKIEMSALSNSIGVIMLSALAEQVFQRVTSKEYSINYFHGPIIIFKGTLHSLNVVPRANTTLCDITIEINAGSNKVIQAVKQVGKIVGTVPL